jgi:RNA polymerase sigma-70 factor (ECF subfamily)
MSTGPAGDEIDADSQRWLDELASDAPERGDAVARLHALLLRACWSDLNRRRGRTPVVGQELEDLAHQAADDAVISILRKLDTFRGASRFTTWAYKFAIVEVSSKLGRHFWQRSAVRLDEGGWEGVPDRFGMTPEVAAQSRELLDEVRRIVENELTDRQRNVFVALVVDATPLDALVAKLCSSRNAIYKTMFDARRKVRAALVANGYLEIVTARQNEQHERPRSARAVPADGSG